MSSLLEIIEGISQVLAVKHDGAGKEIGLMREKEINIYQESRIVDGFGVQFHGNMITVKYQTEMPLTAVHDKTFETDIRNIMKDIASFLKTEFKSLKKSNLKLTEYGDIKILVQTRNRYKATVNAAQSYEIAASSYSEENNEVLARLTKGWLESSRQG